MHIISYLHKHALTADTIGAVVWICSGFVYYLMIWIGLVARFLWLLLNVCLLQAYLYASVLKY